jgi:hypothetical protein
MKALKLFAVLSLSLATSSFAANLVVNSSFEDPITYDGPPFVGSWEGFMGGGATAGNSSVLPRTGLQSVALSINNTPNTFAGVFQDIPGLVSGTEYTFAGWHVTPSSPLNLGVEVRIEWRNALGNNEVSRTPNLTPVPSAEYSPFSLTAAVPAGADTARIVYAIQSFSTFPLGNGTVHVDDFSFMLVPEPSAVALLALGGAAVMFFRRQRR